MPGQPAVRGTLVSRTFARQLPRRFPGLASPPLIAVAQRRLARWQRRVAATLGPASGLSALHDAAAVPLVRMLGYSVERLTTPSPADLHLSRIHKARIPPMLLAVTPWSDRLDSGQRMVLREAARRQARWVLSFNGRLLRLLDADRPLARRFLEFDMMHAADDTDAVVALWVVLRADTFVPARGHGPSPIDEIVQASASHDRRVARHLQHGVRASLTALALALRQAEPRRTTPDAAVVRQSLTIVFRLLFLLFAEARALVPVWHPVYRHSYLVDGLRQLAERHDRCDGLWEGLQAISRLAHDGCDVGDLRVTAFNGQLFSPDRTPLGEAARVDEEVMRLVLRSLTRGPDEADEHRGLVTYGDLGVEELGAVYERLLDASPEVERLLEHGHRQPRPSPRGPRVSTRRKESGTFYTPREMADHLVRQTLTPLVRDLEADRILALRVLDPAMGSGAFLVAACRFLAEAYERALEREDRLPRHVARSRARAGYRRLVAQRCLFGVDVNPVAAGLARLSLWLATLAAEVPLTFLDHHLRVGDSLLGASVDDLARGWRPGRAGRSPFSARAPQPPLPLVEGDLLAGLMRDLVPLRARLAAPDESAQIVRDKERTLDHLLATGGLARLLALADAWCAWFSWPGPSPQPPRAAWPELADHALAGRSRLPAQLGDRWLDAAQRAGADRRFFHWQLQFPEVFFAADGTRRPDAGFDAIIGNPPWDMVRADVRDPDLRRRSKEDAAALTRFVREAGVYEGARDGHVNRYQLFVERSLGLARHGGRLGLVAPWGLFADYSAAPLRQRLLERCDTDEIVGFENAEAIFPIHRSQRFVLLTTTTGRPTSTTRCRLGERSLAALDRATPVVSGPAGHPVLSISLAFVRRVSGEGLALPWLRGARDLALLEALDRRWPALGSPDGWHVAFGRELNATDDRALFSDKAGGIPVVDGRHLSPFRARTDACVRTVSGTDLPALARRVPGVLRHRLAYRDVSSATNRLTLIAAILPPLVVSTHTVFCLRSRLDLASQWCLCALMNSFVANYLVRLRVTAHVTTAIVSRLPVPRLEVFSPMARELASLARTLAGSGRTAGPDHARLQALAARAYEVDATQFADITSTFPLIDPSDRDAAVAEFERLG